MNIEELTDEIEDWLEKADEEETLKFLRYPLNENSEKENLFFPLRN